MELGVGDAREDRVEVDEGGPASAPTLVFKAVKAPLGVSVAALVAEGPLVLAVAFAFPDESLRTGKRGEPKPGPVVPEDVVGK